MYEWDVFISHASEDTQDVAEPLANELRRRGIRVWIDARELEIGDKLREKVGEGLTRSRFGVVVITPRSAAKSWPRDELNALLALEEDGVKRVLPVWHDIDRAGVAAAFPLIADRLAGSTAGGLEALAVSIAGIVLDPKHSSPASTVSSPGRRLVAQFERDPSGRAVRDFLQSEERIIRAAFGPVDSIVWSPVLGSHSADLAIAEHWVSASRMIWSIVILGRADSPLSDGVTIDADVDVLAGRLEAIRKWMAGNLAEARDVLDEVETGFQGMIITGRRPPPGSSVAAVLRDYNDMQMDVRVRTYDWLVDAAFKMEVSPGGRS